MSQSQINQPSVTIAIANANVTVENTPLKSLFVGQMTSGSATPGSIVSAIGNDGEEDALFGIDSQIAAAIRGFRKVNGVGRVDAIPLADAGAGVPRVVVFTLVGLATGPGTVDVTYGSERNNKATIPVASSDTVTAIADAITVAITADASSPFTASNVAGLVTLTAVNDGTNANKLGVEVVIDAAGVVVSGGVTQTTPGSVDPVLTGVLDVATERYQLINWPYDDTTEVAAFLGPRFNATNAILDGVAFVPRVGTLAELTDGSTGILDLLNDQNLVLFCDKSENVVGANDSYLGPAQNEAGWVRNAYFMAVVALRMTEGENVASFVTSRASRDQIGGVAHASLPFFNTPLALLPLIKPGRGWDDGDIQTLFLAGGSVIGVNTANTTGLVGEVVTTYKTDAAGNPDPTFQFYNYVLTEVSVREFRFNNLKARFAQSRLTQGALSRNRDMANKASITAFIEGLFKTTGDDDHVLTQSGNDAERFYKENLDVILDLASGLVTVTDLTPIVTQLRQIVMTMKVSFSVTS